MTYERNLIKIVKILQLKALFYDKDPLKIPFKLVISLK